MAVKWLYALNVFSIYISKAECVGKLECIGKLIIVYYLNFQILQVGIFCLIFSVQETLTFLI